MLFRFFFAYLSYLRRPGLSISPPLFLKDPRQRGNQDKNPCQHCHRELS